METCTDRLWSGCSALPRPASCFFSFSKRHRRSGTGHPGACPPPALSGRAGGWVSVQCFPAGQVVELQGFLPLVFSLLGFCPAACFLKSQAVESGSPVWGLIALLSGCVWGPSHPIVWRMKERGEGGLQGPWKWLHSPWPFSFWISGLHTWGFWVPASGATLTPLFLEAVSGGHWPVVSSSLSFCVSFHVFLLPVLLSPCGSVSFCSRPRIILSSQPCSCILHADLCTPWGGVTCGVFKGFSGVCPSTPTGVLLIFQVFLDVWCPGVRVGHQASSDASVHPAPSHSPSGPSP